MPDIVVRGDVVRRITVGGQSLRLLPGRPQSVSAAVAATLAAAGLVDVVAEPEQPEKPHSKPPRAAREKE